MAESAPSAPRLSLATRIGYGAGDFGINLSLNFAGFYLLYFLTDVLAFPAARAGIILLVARIWCTGLDPVMGWLVDHRTFPGAGRFGNKRACLLIGMIPIGLFTFLTYTSPDLSPGVRFAWSLGAYFLYATSLSLISIPYGALTASLTDNPADRNSMTAYRMAFGILGSLAAAGATLPLVHLISAPATGFLVVALGYGLIQSLTTGMVFWLVPADQVRPAAAPGARKIGTREQLANRPFWILTGALTTQVIAVTLVAAVMSYFFKYNVGNEGLVPAALLALFVAALAAIPLVNFSAHRIGYQATYLLGALLLASMFILIFFIPLTTPWIFPVLATAGAALSTYFVCPWSMIPDTLDYAEWKSGSRPEGLLYGFFNLGVKLGFTVSGSLAALVLWLGGYLPNVAQTARALFAIRSLASWIPAGFVLLSAALILRYPLSGGFQERVRSELAARRKREER